MDVSIIIINYNTFELSCQCIRSVKEKTKLNSYEIILVDNASTETNARKFLDIFPEIKLIQSKKNLGFARGNNLGITEASGQYILLLNSDAFLQNDAVSVCYDSLESNPTVAVATGRLEYPDGRIQNNCQRFPSVGALLFELIRMQKILPRLGEKVLLGPFFQYDKVAYPDWVWGTFFMFRRSLLNELPGQKLAEDFFMYGEDMQWCWEFRKRGYEIFFDPAARIVHMMGGSGGLKQDLIDANHREFLGKNYPPWKRLLISGFRKLL